MRSQNYENSATCQEVSVSFIQVFAESQEAAPNVPKTPATTSRRRQRTTTMTQEMAAHMANFLALLAESWAPA